MYEVFIPRASRDEDKAVVQVVKADSWILNSYKAYLNNYQREFLKGDHFGLQDADAMIQK